MKRAISLLLVLVLTLSLCACGAEKNQSAATDESKSNSLNETVSTDVVEFTLTRFEYAKMLKNASFQTGKAPDPEYLLPTEEEQSNNPFAADDGKTMISFSYTLKNTGKEELTFPVNLGITADYNDGYTFEASVDVIKGDFVILKDTTSLDPLSDACEGRGYIKVPMEVMEKEESPLYLKVSLPVDSNSEKTTEIVYKIR